MPTLNVNGAALNVVDRGHGRPVLFVHGFPLTHAMWQAQINAFAESHRVIVPDLRGFGASSVTEPVVTMRQFADDLAAVINGLGITEPITYCGLSMGGYIGWAFIRHHAARLRALILCDTRAGADTPDGTRGRLQMAESVLTDGVAPVADAMIPKLFAESTLRDRPEVVNSVREMILGTAPAGIAAALRGMAERPDSTPLLEEIDVPALLIVGAQDQITTVDEMRGMARRIPGASFEEIEAAGHMAPMEQPESVNARMHAFLQMLD